MPAVKEVGGRWASSRAEGSRRLRNPDRPFLATLPAPHHHQPGPCLGPQTIQWAGRPGKPMPPPHTLQWHNTIAPHTLQWGRPTMQQLDTLEGNAWDTMPQCSTPTESDTCPKGSDTTRPRIVTRFLFGNSRCVRVVHAALADGRIHASYGW